MRDSTAIVQQPTTYPPARQLWLLTILFGVLWLAQLRYPPLSYPHIGLLLLSVASIMGLILPYLVWKATRITGSRLLRHPALLPGAAFAGWMLLRWLMEGMLHTGAAGAGNLLWTAVYIIVTISLALLSGMDKLTSQGSVRSAPLPLGLIFLVLLSAVGLLSGIHAIWQHHFAYADAYRELAAAIGGRNPDRTELGLLHHLQLRRVGSIWGDPNALATFSAMAVCASLELMTYRDRWQMTVRGIAIASMLACLAAIYYTGSRGGVLDVAAVIFLFGGYLLIAHRGRFKGKAPITSILTITGLILMNSAAYELRAQTGESITETVTTEDSIDGGWVWRSETIRERLYYLQVGARMVQMAPMMGLGPGSVELYFGRLKPSEAREARHLHNWAAQVGAESGVIGLVLLVWFLGAVAVSSWKAGLHRLPVYRALIVLFFLFIFDGLIQISWHQRELMCTFGIVCGLLIAGSRRPGEPNKTKLLTAAFPMGAMGIAAILGLFEMRTLSAKSNKQLASDAAYAGDFITAEKYWTRATMWDSRDPEPLAARASVARDRGQFSAARALVEKALAAQPASAATNVLAAEIYKQLRQPDKVDRHLTKALELYPSHPEYNGLYARHLQSKGEIAKALIYADSALKYSYTNEDKEKFSALVAKLQAAAKENS